MVAHTTWPELRRYLESGFRGDVLTGEPLALHTWYRIGGPADFFAYPLHADDLGTLLDQAAAAGCPATMLGDGANVLAHDQGYRGIVICLTRYFTEITRHDLVVEAQAGVLLPDLVLFCEKNSLGGLEQLAGIPGSVGGALIMNAGTRSAAFGDVVESVAVLDAGNRVVWMPRSEFHFEYRNTPELQKKIILACRLSLRLVKEEALRTVRESLLAGRSEKQPLEYPSCGSVFKSPSGRFVGQMVEELGLKGFRHGDAMVSEKHGGFIVNLGNATSADVIYVIRKVADEINNRYGVAVEPEVRFLGF